MSPAATSSSRTSRRIARRVGSATARNAASIRRTPCLLPAARKVCKHYLTRLENPVDLVDALDRTFDHTHSVIAGIKPEQYDAATPCSEWNVRALMEHMVGVVAMMGAAAAGQAPQPAQEFELAPDPAAQFADIAKHTIAGWRTPGILDATINAGPGDLPGRVYANINLLDTATHTWDLA